MNEHLKTEQKAIPPGLYASPSLEWLKVLLPVLVSWPVVGLIAVLVFHGPITLVIERFSQASESAAELGPIKIKLGKPVLPPEFRESGKQDSRELIDLANLIEPVGDTGQYGSTIGFGVMYAIRAEQASSGQESSPISPWGIYETGKKYDEFPGENYEGTSILGALNGAKKFGVYSEEDWPYASGNAPAKDAKPLFKINGYKRCNTVSQILDALRKRKVVVAKISVTRDFDTIGDRGKVVIKLPVRSDFLGSKAVAIVGYDSASAEFTFANDWGIKWGDKGFGRIKDSDLAEILADGYIVEL